MVFLNRLILADAPEAAPIPDKMAHELLVFGCPILDVSAMCGFRDYHTFLKAFQREVGITPKQYARFSGV